MKEKDRKFFLTPYNPFGSRQAKIVELVANGATYKEIASALGVSYQAIKNQVSGYTTNNSVFNTIEEITEQRPNKKGWIDLLIGDVLFIRENGK